MTEDPATVAQRILDARKQMVADYETLKRVRKAKQLKELEEIGRSLADVATGHLPLDDLRDLTYRASKICADLELESFISPDLKEFLEPPDLKEFLEP